MYASVVTAQVRPEQFDEALAAYRALLAEAPTPPQLQRLVVAGDRATGKTLIIGLWSVHAGTQAAAAELQAQVESVAHLLVGTPTAEVFEVLLEE